MDDFYAKMEKYEFERKVNLPKLIEILKQHGIEMNVDACGCCDSPWISAWYKGEKIVENAMNGSFSMREDKEEKNT